MFREANEPKTKKYKYFVVLSLSFEIDKEKHCKMYERLTEGGESNFNAQKKREKKSKTKTKETKKK